LDFVRLLDEIPFIEDTVLAADDNSIGERSYSRTNDWSYK
jgi:hypothetical protein